MAKRLTEAQERERATWQYRCVEATRGPQTKLGTILLAVLSQQRKTIPRFVGQATITSDGFVMCSFLDKAFQFHSSALVCDVSDLVKNFSGLADYLKLNDRDRIELFQAVRNWIAADYRANDTLHFTVERR